MQGRNLKQRLQETTQCYHEFEQLIEKLRSEKSDTQEKFEQTSQQIIKLQSRLIEQNMEKVELEKKLFELKHSTAMLNQTRDDLQQAQLRICMLEQNLAQETDDLEMALKDLQKYKNRSRDMQEKLFALQEKKGVPVGFVEEVEQVEQIQEPVEVTEVQTPAQSDFNAEQVEEDLEGHDVNSDYLKRKLLEATSRIEHLNLQLHDQTKNLKQAHMTINQLRGQKAPTAG